MSLETVLPLTDAVVLEKIGTNSIIPSPFPARHSLFYLSLPERPERLGTYRRGTTESSSDGAKVQRAVIALHEVIKEVDLGKMIGERTR